MYIYNQKQMIKIMKKYIFMVLLLAHALISIQAQSNVSVQKVVFINDALDRIIDSVGNVGITLRIGSFQTYYYCLYFSIQTNDMSVFDTGQSPFYVKFSKHNDTIPTYLCESINQDLDGNTLIWVIAPFDDRYLPYDKEFIVQDIEQACNQMSSAFQESVDLMYFDVLNNKYQNIVCKNFSAPYYSEEKAIYHQLCPYPLSLQDLEKYKTKNIENLSSPEFDFGEESFDEIK